MDDTLYQRKMEINSLPGRPIIKEWKLSSFTLMRILSVILSYVWLAVNSKYSDFILEHVKQAHSI
jgi:hypothetical protein